MHDAAVLISVHGADCMNLMFLPPRSVILEISPTHYGAPYTSPPSLYSINFLVKF